MDGKDNNMSVYACVTGICKGTSLVANDSYTPTTKRFMTLKAKNQTSDTKKIPATVCVSHGKGNRFPNNTQ